MPQLAVDEPGDCRLDPRLFRALRVVQECGEAAELRPTIVEQILVEDQQSRVRIQLGPLTLEQYIDFLPGHEGNRQLRAITRFYSGGEYDVEVQLILRKQEVPVCELKPQDGSGPQLGWTSWVKTAEFTRDASETILEL